MSMARAALLAALCGIASASAQELPALRLDPDATTVSGLSSGAFMAVQVHVAFSDSIAGAGIVAGGPFYCAEGSVLRAISTCMNADGDGPDVAPLLEAARGFDDADLIAPLSGLAGDRVYLFSGTKDETVTRPAVASAARFYRQAGVAAADLSHVTDVPAGHAFLVPGGPVPCGETEPPFISDCGVEQARDILTWLHGPLEPAAEPVRAHLAEFDQGLFLTDPVQQEMHETGYVYVPATCSAGAECRLHIAFHGCQQGAATLGDRYAWTTGYNGWAEAKGIVVLYPQAQASITGGNPNGCWDWWGYGGDTYATRQGPQMVAVARMAAALGVAMQGDAPICVAYDDFNAVHFNEGRADACGLSLCAVGSGDDIGPWTGASVLYGTAVGQFTTTACALP
jgi:poly(3-hydroxybutyrate) depolymerase